MSEFPPLLPADGSFSNEMRLLQGVGHRHAFYGRPPGQRFYAELIGEEADSSPLPMIYEYWFEKLGMTAEYRRRHVAPEQIGDYVGSSIADPAWRGCNLSPSLKRAALPHVSLMAKSVEGMPFVDTLFRYKAGWPAGLTTAGAAFWQAFTSGLTEADSPKVWMAGFQIIGSGALGTTLAAVLAGQRMTNIWIYARDPDEGRRTAQFAGLGPERVLSIEQLRPLPQSAFGPYAGQINVIINATQLGSKGQPELALDLQQYPPDTHVIDFAHEVPETSSVGEARRLGFRTVTSIDIAIEQAAQSFFFFYLTQAPRQHDAELRARLAA